MVDRQLIPLTIINTTNNEETRKNVPLGTDLLSVLRNIYPTASFPCNGTGTCGKCKVRIVQGTLPITTDDYRCLTESERNAGYRLACSALCQEPLSIQFSPINTNHMRIANYSSLSYTANENTFLSEDSQFCIGLDIGTTTIALQAGSYNDAWVNPQTAFGADVLSRILYDNQDSHHSLQTMLLDSLEQHLLMLESRMHRIQIPDHCTMVITGNTTMLHLLQGYSCESLGTYPFTPYSTATRRLTWMELHPNTQLSWADALTVLVLPVATAFLGADLLCGIDLCQMLTRSRPSLLLDLGTNGEMALWNGHELYGTSVAAGPALEGASLSCGIASIPGAVYNIEIKGTSKSSYRILTKTIGGKLPIGICGTGALACLSELLRTKQMDSNGLLEESIRNNGLFLSKSANGSSLVLTQDDIRKLQLALASIRAGYRCLISHANCREEDIHTIFLAGGLGTYLSIQQATAIGLFPVHWENKLLAVGNTAVAGAFRCACQPQRIFEHLQPIATCLKHIDLAQDKQYQTSLLDEMSFSRKTISNICE